MNAGLLEKLLGGDRVWSGACVVILDADAEVQAAGPDSIGGGGSKAYAPRYGTGRIDADACCLLRDLNALLIVDETRNKDQTGAEVVRQKMLAVDVGHVAGLEFKTLHPLRALGVPAPKIVHDVGYRPGMLVG